MEPVCYFNGAIVPLSAARVSVCDIGLLRGFGIYQAVRSYGPRPFMLAEHLGSLRRSAKAMNLTVPASDAQIDRAIGALIEKNIAAGKDAVIRIILTGGEATDALEYDLSRPTFYILCDVLQPLSATLLLQGARLIAHEYLRPFPESKTTNYVEAVLLQPERIHAGALDILYTWQGNALECATSNFFIVKDGSIMTPRNNVLLGVTRSVVIDLAREEFPLEERDVSVEEMHAADEAFLTASFKEVVPIVEVGGKPIGNGTPGLVTKRIMALFSDLTRPHEARGS